MNKPVNNNPSPTVNKPANTGSAAVNGNSKNSNRPQHVDAITKTDANGKTTIHKVGISGGGISGSGASGRKVLAPTRDYSDRALNQTRHRCRGGDRKGSFLPVSAPAFLWWVVEGDADTRPGLGG